MLFFQLDFFLLFLIPLVASVAVLKAFGVRSFLAWVASAASLTFLFVDSATSGLIAVLSICINYFAARYLLSHRTSKIFAAAVTANLAMLAYFKYSGWFAESSSWAWHMLLPLGISFYTFQQIAFLADVYRGKVSSFSFRTYILFKLFFPQFIAGPITHFERVRASYERWPTFNARSIRYGLTIFSIGMAKKLAGDYFGGIANPIFANQAALDVYTAWLGMLAFTFQIYFDFSGYSDMAVGLARLFGVSLPFNFNSPYKARSISDFWRRWHMTLSRWLRDYLYVPLGGNRHGAPRTIAALMITMTLGGLWHGANWTFVAWGMAHGLALVATRYVTLPDWSALKRVSTFLSVTLAWILFRSETFTGALQHYLSLVPGQANLGLGIELLRIVNLLLPFTPGEGGFNKPNQLIELTAIVAAFTVCLTAPNSQQIALWFVARRIYSLALADIPVLIFIVAMLAFAMITPDTRNAFIYFQF
ncbi:MAG: alginate O-acetyltransferase complex protein AlgI [Bradyrhizobium sp.]|jgi:D-alanyl-lipoteichoic acid acyltransferase DltB (MBOAT superfamily)|nr:alginate O-acetyltransferase complex protein AlgI [Bradyrhizobium sp.]